MHLINEHNDFVKDIISLMRLESMSRGQCRTPQHVATPWNMLDLIERTILSDKYVLSGCSLFNNRGVQKYFHPLTGGCKIFRGKKLTRYYASKGQRAGRFITPREG